MYLIHIFSVGVEGQDGLLHFLMNEVMRLQQELAEYKKLRAETSSRASRLEEENRQLKLKVCSPSSPYNTQRKAELSSWFTLCLCLSVSLKTSVSDQGTTSFQFNFVF